jgi:hypothetical protein
MRWGVAEVWLLFIGPGRRSASGVGAPSNHRPVTGEETRGCTPFYEGKRRGGDDASDA